MKIKTYNVLLSVAGAAWILMSRELFASVNDIYLRLQAKLKAGLKPILRCGDFCWMLQEVESDDAKL